MRIQKLVVVSFLALVIGATLGLLKDEVVSISETKKYEGLRPEHFVDESSDYPAARDEVFENKEVACLSEIMFREGQNQSVGVRRLIGLTTIARRDDNDPQWKRTICGIMHQKGQISGVNNAIDLNPAQLRILQQTQQIAAELYESVWKTQLMPRGWECVRYWKVSDKKLATLGAPQLAQLGISESMRGLRFFEKLEAVEGPPGDVTFYYDPNRCRKPLPAIL